MGSGFLCLRSSFFFFPFCFILLRHSHNHKVTESASPPRCTHTVCVIGECLYKYFITALRTHTVYVNGKQKLHATLHTHTVCVNENERVLIQILHHHSAHTQAEGFVLLNMRGRHEGSYFGKSIIVLSTESGGLPFNRFR